MWFIKRLFVLVAIVISGCTPPVSVDMSVIPAVPTTVKIQRLAGDSSNPSNCTIPCSVKIEHGDNYRISFDSSGYYPVTLNFDWTMAFYTSERNEHTPLVIPLIQRKLAKDDLKKSQQ